MKKNLLKTFFLTAAMAVGMTAQAQKVGDIIVVDDVQYEIAGSNIIVNGSFDDGVNNWYAGAWDAADPSNYTLETSGGFDGGAYLTYSAGGAGAATNIRNKWDVEVGKTYLFRCYTSGQTPASNNFIYSFLAEYSETASNNEGTKLYQLKWGAPAEQVSSEWTENNFVFKANVSTVVFRSSWTTNTKLDGFFLAEVTLPLSSAKALLQAEIDAAQQLLGNELFKNGTDALQAAINTAQSILDSATTIDQINEAIDALKAAEDVFSNANKKFFLQNMSAIFDDAPSFWGAGNDWGTRASLVPHPEYVTLIPLPNGKYNLDSQVSNGGNSHYFNGDYMDQTPPAELTITKVGEPLGYLDEAETIPVYAYTIANDDNYFGWDGESTVLGKNLSADSYYALWIIASFDEAKAALSDATDDNPMDATFLIENHNFGRNNRWGQGLSTKDSQVKNADLGAAWTFDASNKDVNGNNTNYCVESFHSVFTISQIIEGAPAGVYELTAQGFYREDEVDGAITTIDLPVFFANEETASFPVMEELPDHDGGGGNSMGDASIEFTNGNYTIEPIKFTVAEDGQITIGARLEQSTNLWCIFDNFTLMYYGSGVTDGITTVSNNVSPKSNAIYTLGGQRVNNAQKGIYIIDGKKVVK